MDYVMVTLRYQQNEADLELPTGVPFFNLVPIFMKQLNWETADNHDKFVGRIGGVVLRPYETLAQLDVLPGAIVELLPIAGEELLEQEPDSSETMPTPGGDKTAYLRSRDSGESLPLSKRSLLIGRGPNSVLNLKRFPNSDVVSGQHANLVRREDGYWLTDENSTNGTLVDGILLRPGESVRLRPGSQIQFGETGPVFSFHWAEP